MTTPYRCKDCEVESWHPKDKEYGWCASCKKYTAHEGVYELLSDIEWSIPASEELGFDIDSLSGREMQFYIDGYLAGYVTFNDTKCSLKPTNSQFSAKMVSALSNKTNVEFSLMILGKSGDYIHGYLKSDKGRLELI